MNKKIFNILFEQENVDSPEQSMKLANTDFKARKALDSVDDQIDALIIRYESASIRDESKEVDGLLESLQNKNMKFLIEQEEEEPLDDFGGDEPADTATDTEATEDAGTEEAPDPEGSEKINPAEEVEDRIPDLDIDAFAARTVRLIVNYKNLLRVEEAICNRIKHFLDQNYGDKFVQRYVEILANQYGIEMNEFDDDRETQDDNFAVGAFAGGTGGLGGGG